MKAVVLVGGEGTRMRPLTETVPKPLIPLVDRPFLSHILGHLDRHGVEEALLSSPYLGEAFEEFVASFTSGPRIRWITEETPLGTGGAVANAARGLSEPLLVLNGDILTDLDLRALVSFHRRTRATATLTVVPVPDARGFGLVSMDRDAQVLAFREKPEEPVEGLVNAGTYVLEPEALVRIPDGRAVSIERETFPELIRTGRPMRGFVFQGYWMDVGTPQKYLRATFDVLEGLVRGLDYPAPYVHPEADVALRAHLGRWVVVGAGARVGPDAEIEDSVVLGGASIGARARVRDTIVGPGATIGDDAQVEGAVLAEHAAVAAATRSSGARVRPGHALER